MRRSGCRTTETKDGSTTVRHYDKKLPGAATRTDGWPEREYTDFHWYRDQRARLEGEAEQYVGVAGQTLITFGLAFKC